MQSGHIHIRDRINYKAKHNLMQNIAFVFQRQEQYFDLNLKNEMLKTGCIG